MRGAVVCREYLTEEYPALGDVSELSVLMTAFPPRWLGCAWPPPDIGQVRVSTPTSLGQEAAAARWEAGRALWRSPRVMPHRYKTRSRGLLSAYRARGCDAQSVEGALLAKRGPVAFAPRDLRALESHSHDTEAVMQDLSTILESTDVERHSTGHVFTEGPLWHPDGFFYFNDIRPGTLYTIELGGTAREVRKTAGGNGLTFDLEGRLIHCEGDARCVTRTEHNGEVVTLAERFNAGRFNRPNDVVCHSDGSLWFTDPSMRVPFAEREIPGTEGVLGVWAGAAVYRLAPDGEMTSVVTVEYPNGLAFCPQERTLYIANTRSSTYIHAVDLNADGSMRSRRIFADMSADDGPGIPDGMKVDALGRVFCTGSGGIWVFDPDGTHLGTIRLPEMAVNLTFGGEDLRTLFVTAVTSVYTLRVKTPGLPHPWYAVRAA
ncbi:MAG: SMP-30/gluconolactonase/LRE family protein, partial [Gammaproteobacteria bacterium]|nr:SMP-30/gluconolactonase/LRE family protein [Gammaproteobacteria bacterium]